MTAYPLHYLYFYLTSGCNLRCRHCWMEPAFHSNAEPAPSLDVDLFASIVRDQVSAKTGFREFERIGPFALIPGPLAVGDELSGKQEVKRHVIAEKYASEIASLF